MRIGLIGGLERLEHRLARIAKDAGYEVEFHDGHMEGRGALALASLVERVDLVVIATEVNSHGAVQLAKRLCHRVGRDAIVVRTAGPARFRELLEGLSVGAVRGVAV